MIEVSAKRPKLTRKFFAVGALAAALFFLGYSLYKNWRELQTYQWHFDPLYLMLAVIALLLAFVSNVVGWALIIKRLGGPTSLRKNTEIYCLAAHGKRLPGLVWYVAGRAFLYERENVPVSTTVQGSLWEMLLHVLTGLTIYALFWPFYQGAQQITLFFVAAIPVGLLALSPPVFRRLFRWFRRDQSSGQIIQIDWRSKALWFGVYLLGWLAGGSILFFLIGAVSFVSLELLPACWGFVALSSVISILTFFLPGGIGAREVSLSLLLGAYMPISVAVSLALLFRIWILVGETILLIVVWSVIQSRFLDWIRAITQRGY